MSNKEERRKKETMKEYLEYVRDTEVAKPIEEIDEELVMETSKAILELGGKTDYTLTDEEVQRRVSEIFDEKCDNGVETNNGKIKKYKKKSKGITLKRIAALAACIAVLVGVVAVPSTASSDPYMKYLIDKYGSVLDIPLNTEFKFGNVTFMLCEVIELYADIDEFAKDLNKKVLYPSYFPEDIELYDEMTYAQETDGVYTLIYNSVGADFSCTISFDSEMPESQVKHYSDVKIGDMDCKWLKPRDGWPYTQIYFEYNGDTYLMIYNDTDELIKIIESLEVKDYEK